MRNKDHATKEDHTRVFPVRSERVGWSAGDDGKVTLDVENTGCFNRIAQRLFGRPKISHIHLDGLGSFVWQRLDGQTSVGELAAEVENTFGERAHPIYERLDKFLRILHSYKFIYWK